MAGDEEVPRYPCRTKASYARGGGRAAVRAQGVSAASHPAMKKQASFRGSHSDASGSGSASQQ